jgi:hypothetical protein
MRNRAKIEKNAAHLAEAHASVEKLPGGRAQHPRTSQRNANAASCRQPPRPLTCHSAPELTRNTSMKKVSISFLSIKCEAIKCEV